MMPMLGRSATTLAAEVRAGRLSARQVVRDHLDHLAHVEHRLGAYVVVRRRQALDEAEAVDARDDRERLPLAGVPVAIKDVVDVAGEATRHGSLATSDEPTAVDHEVVARLKAAGAIVIGKTRCPELCLWATSDDAGGIAVSPWDPSRSAGGSSGGSGAAVSAGTVPLALATDGLGSIRIPAAATGCFGFKPGADLLPEELDGVHHVFGMSRFGPLATTVADGSLMLAVMAGREPAGPPKPPDRTLRVAVSWAVPLPGLSATRPWVEAAIEAGRLLHHAGHEVRRADPPYDMATVNALTSRAMQAAAEDVASMGLDLAALEPRTRAQAVAGHRLARRVPASDEQARHWRERVAPFLAEHDVLITPAAARQPPAARAWRQRSWAANLASSVAAYPFPQFWNLADTPAAVVPLWHEAGRPLAVQVVAAQGREDLVLAVAAQLEALAPWERHAPGWGVAAGTSDTGD